MIPDTAKNALGAGLRLLATLSPAAAAAIAFRVFTTPVGARSVRLEGKRLKEAQGVLSAARREDRDGMAVWVWETGGEEETVLLVHGWTSRTLYMTAFVDPLRRAGYRVVSVDLPAHGESGGSRLNFHQAGKAVVELANHFGPTVLLGHSFGASMCVLAAHGAPTLEPTPHATALVLVAGANRLEDVSARFCQEFGLPASIKHRIDRKLEEIGGDPIARFTSVRGINGTGLPTLLVHDADDRIVPVEDSRTVAGETHAELVETARLGHNRILYAKQAHDSITDFLAAREAVEARWSRLVRHRA